MKTALALTPWLLLAAFPASAASWLERCEAGVKAGETIACEHALIEQPNDPLVLRRLGEAYFNAERYLEGHESFQKALRLAPNDADLHYDYASLLVLVNEYHEGVREAEIAVRLKPNHRLAWSLLATCYRYMKQPQPALRATRRAAELGDRREAYTLAHYHATGQDGAARDPLLELRWLERAATAGHAEAMEELGLLYAQGRPGIMPDMAKSKQWRERAARAAGN